VAIKGLSYAKTSWVFEERPVSSSKLNQWDDRIESALETAFFLLNQAWGGGSGVLRGVGPGELGVSATAPESLAVSVAPGYAFIDAFPFRLKAATNTAAIAPPLTEGRIDLVQADLATWSMTVKEGVEGASPSVPAVDAGAIALAELVLRPGMASIKDLDDGVNGYVVDVRAFL
jgi:hypothetical protein